MQTPDLELFHFVEAPHGVKKTLFLLHGTGGDERDLVPLVEPLADKYNFVGLRGNVQEHGMNRFFERTAQGVFNQDSIQGEVTKLATFIKAWMVGRQLTSHELAYVGYSNGANMILALLLKHPELVETAVVLHPMLPFEPPKLDLSNKKILITYGDRDQMIPATQTKKAIEYLQKSGASVTIFSHPGGHEVTLPEIAEVRSFLSHL